MINETKTKISSCPFSSNKNEINTESIVKRIMDNTNTNTNDLNIKVCPYKPTNIIGEDSDDDDQNNGSGCPVMNRIQKELDTNFSFCYELPIYHQNDFYFDIRGESLTNKEYNEKTKNLKTMPRHLKFTLFHMNEEKMKKIREKEFTIIYFVYDEIKMKANKLYRNKKYFEALKYFTYCYSCFKWLEFNDKNRKNILDADKLQPILDEDVIVSRIKTDPNFDYEEISFKGTLVNILKSMSFTYMHLRNFSEAIKCLNEALEYSDEKVAELYFRRAQARMYNKSSEIEKLNTLALCDLQKAISMKPEEMRYQEELKILKELIDDLQIKENEKYLKLISNAKYSFNKIKEKNLNIEHHLYNSYEQFEMDLRILEEMWIKYKQTLKFHSENKNEKQVEIAYKEIDSFKDVYAKFKWYYYFDINKLPKQILDLLNEEDRNLIKNSKFQRIINDFKFKSCEYVFSKANLNIDLYKYILEQIIQEDKIKKEVKKKYEDKEDDLKKSKFDSFLNSRIGIYIFSFLLVFISLILIGYHYNKYANSVKN